MNSVARALLANGSVRGLLCARGAALLLRARAVLVLVLLLIVFAALTPDFLTANNLSILAKHVAIFAILAIGMTFVGA